MPHAIIVDDQEVGIQVLSHLLEVSGVSYTAIKDPDYIEEVLNEVSEVNVIFLDLELPQINGYEILAFLKNELQVSIPIIAYTVNTSEAAYAKEVGFDGFLGKPIDREQFPTTIRRILNGESVWETS